MVWGKMILKSNGLSYMDFKLQVDVNKAINFTLNERYNGGYKFLNQDISNPFSFPVGTWTAGVPTEMDFDVALFNANRVYKIVSVIQPPFMQWNKTLREEANYSLFYFYCQGLAPKP